MLTAFRRLALAAVAAGVATAAYPATVTIRMAGREVVYHCRSTVSGVTCEPVGPICGGDLNNKDCWEAVHAVLFPKVPAVSVHLMKLARCWAPAMLQVVRALNDKAYSGIPVPELSADAVDAYNCCALVANRYAPSFTAHRERRTLDGYLSTGVGESSGPPVALVATDRDLRCDMPSPHPFDEYLECARHAPAMKPYRAFRFYFADYVVDATGRHDWTPVGVPGRHQPPISCGSATLMCTVSPKRRAVSCSLAQWPDATRGY
jgi:hypothetical protein